MRKTLAAAFGGVLLLGAVAHAEEKPDPGGVALGVLMCQKDPGTSGFTFVFASRHPVTCDYEGVGKSRTYEGTSGIYLGIDLEYQMEDGMTYVVMGAGESPDSLLGRYFGGKATVRIGGGVSAQAGLVGVGNGIMLVPMGLGGGAGAGFAGGVSYLELTKLKNPHK